MVTRAYPDYRDSGVEWLGDMPEHWTVHPFQRVLRESLKYGANEAAELDDPHHPRFVRITDIDDAGRLRDETFRSLPPEVAKPYLLSSGDLLFARSGSIGRTFLYDDSWGPCAYAGYLIRARIDHSQATPQFVSYFTASQSYEHWLRTVAIQATIENVSAERYSRMPIPLPPLDEQQAIAAFLDRETERIDGLVEKKRLLIERLEEYQTALITRTVTRGLPPEAARATGLDPSPRLKTSGVEWLGDVPEHWEVLPLQRLLGESLQYGANEAAELDDPSLPRFVRITDIDPAGRLREDTFRSLPQDLAKPYLLRSGDLLFARSGATVGRTFLYDESWGTCAYAGYLVRARVHFERAVSRFIWYFSATTSYTSWLRAVQIQATIQNVSAERYSRLPIPVPPLAEQQAIVAFLDHETQRVRVLADRVKLNIERLMEYRAALITAAVTGKIDVREQMAYGVTGVGGAPLRLT